MTALSDEDEKRLRKEVAQAMKDVLGSGYVDDYYFSVSSDFFMVAEGWALRMYERGLADGKAQAEEVPTLKVGDTLYGYCEGYFGRDSYGEKEVLHVGPNYVVVKEYDGHVIVANVDPQRLVKYTTEESYE